MTALPAVSIANIKRNNITRRPIITAKFAGMEKEQDFDVFNFKRGDTSVVILSKTYIGEVFLDSGICRLSKEHSDGAFIMHLAMAGDNSVIQEQDLNQVKEAVHKALV